MLKSGSVMINIINEIDKYPELLDYFSELTDNQKYEYLDAIKSLKRNKLYMSPIHGEYHSERVALFSTILGNRLGCSDREICMLIDASLYHDFMRESDSEDSFHGYSSAIHLSEVIDKGKYNEEELSIIKCMIDYHCLPSNDNKFDGAMLDFNVDLSNRDRCLLLSNILRDADALDRKRFPKESLATLKSEYLTYPESLSMIGLSEEVNKAYIDKTITNDSILSNRHLRCNGIHSCLHSIGKNIFKIGSILDHGLLSYSKILEIDKDLPKNFCGGNTYRWISVVNGSSIDNSGDAKQEFLDNGVVFKYRDVLLYVVDDSVNESYAYSYGLPFRKNDGYNDEEYAFLGIPRDNLVSISISKSISNTEISMLDHFVYNSLSYELFLDNITYYLRCIGISYIPDIFKNDLEEYKGVDLEYIDHLENKDRIDKNYYPKRLDDISCRINKRIGRLLHEYYSVLLNKDFVTLEDAVSYEIGKAGYSYRIIDGDEVVYTIGDKNKTYYKDY